MSQESGRSKRRKLSSPVEPDASDTVQILRSNLSEKSSDYSPYQYAGSILQDNGSEVSGKPKAVSDEARDKQTEAIGRSVFPSGKRRGRPRKSDCNDTIQRTSDIQKSHSRRNSNRLERRYEARDIKDDVPKQTSAHNLLIDSSKKDNKISTQLKRSYRKTGNTIQAKTTTKPAKSTQTVQVEVQDTRQLWPSGKPKGRPRRSDIRPVIATPLEEAPPEKRKRGRPPKAKPSATSRSPLEKNVVSRLKSYTTLKKLRLRFAPSTAEPVVTQPSHLVQPPSHESLSAYLSSFISLDEDVSFEEAQNRAQKNSFLRAKLKKAYADGLLTAEGSPRLAHIKATSIVLSSDHQANMNSHACHFSKLMHDERKRNHSNARKIAAMIQSYFKRLSTADERQSIESQRAMRQLAKRTANEVRRKWKLAEKEVQRRVLLIAQNQQRAAGKEQLANILEQSTSLLKTRMTQRSEDEDDLDSAISEANEDHYLSVEELRMKYAELPDLQVRKSPSESSIDVDPGDDDDEDDNNKGDTRQARWDTTMTPSFHHASGLRSESDCDEAIDSNDSPMDSELDSDDSASTADSSQPGLSWLYPELSDKAAQYNPCAQATDIIKPDELEVEQSQLSPIANRSTRLAERDNQHAAKSDDLMELDSEHSDSSGTDSPMDSEEDVDEDHDLESATENEGPGLAWLYTTPMRETRLAVPGGSIDAAVHKVNLTEQVIKENGDSLDSTSTPEDGSTVTIKTPIPVLLRGTLREYQHAGLDWMAGLYLSKTNGILADEMGLGKTIQTISLLAWLASERHVWGTHLIVVPTSVMLNWEMEFKKFAPGFKVLTYYGTPKERKEKRKGWSKIDTYHVVITSYQLVIHDASAFRRKAWEFMVLDEAHNIKNFKSQRWQTLLNFNTKHRLLLTGTPLQNNLNELWSLLYFLMPQGLSGNAGFANLTDFQEWFVRPVDKLIEDGSHMMNHEARATIAKLHRILRPYILRRLKADVEKQMPGKYEHVVNCRLSNRQRFLYDDFMSRSNTREILSSGNFLSIINCFMQLRKVCNHPDLFESRPVVTSLAIHRSAMADYEIKDLLIRRRLLEMEEGHIPSSPLFLLTANENRSRLTSTTINHLAHDLVAELLPDSSTVMDDSARHSKGIALQLSRHSRLLELRSRQNIVNRDRCQITPIYGSEMRSMLQLRSHYSDDLFSYVNHVRILKPTYEERIRHCEITVLKFACITPRVVVEDIARFCVPLSTRMLRVLDEQFVDESHTIRTATSIAFPDKRLLQFDCGKLQRLDILLRELISGGHRVLIFTQMTKMLDILEQFLNIHGHRYFRLDGATKIESRQSLTERFNSDDKIPVFILSTRSGGLGINLTGADCVIFYDSDWNPCMDRQCQDRAHRIGQTRDVHIYRFVSEFTIEQNIMRKANQKRLLDNVVIGEGDFTTDFFNKVDWKDMLGDEIAANIKDPQSVDLEQALAAAEDQDDAQAAREAQREMDADAVEFEETGPANRPSTVGRQAVTPVGTEEPAPDDDEEIQEFGSIDDYMINFIEREHR